MDPPEQYFERAFTDWFAGGRIEADAKASFIGETKASSEVYVEVSLVGDRSAKAFVNFKGEFVAHLLSFLGTSEYELEAFVHDVTDGSKSVVSNHQITERSESTLTFDPEPWDSLGPSEEYEETFNFNLPVTELQPDHAYQIGYRTITTAATLSKGPVHAYTCMSNSNSPWGHPKGDKHHLDPILAIEDQNNYAKLTGVEIQWESTPDG